MVAVRWAIAIPIALFLLSVWFVHIRPHHPRSAHSASYLVAALLILLVVFTPMPLELTALIMIGTVFCHGAHPGRPLIPRPREAAGANAVRDPASVLQHDSMLRYSVIPDDRRVVSI